VNWKIFSHLSLVIELLLCCLQCSCLQCFDAVGWAAGRASGLQKTEWWGAGMVICPERDAEFGLNVAIPFVRLPATGCYTPVGYVKQPKKAINSRFLTPNNLLKFHLDHPERHTK